MKTLHICGDSFGVSDKASDIIPWHELLATKLRDTYIVYNHCRVSASNLLISLQVEEAINARADYIIQLCTSVTRDQVKFRELDAYASNLVDRFYDITNVEDNRYADLVSYSIVTSANAPFTNSQRQLADEYNKQFGDLALRIYQNQCTISYTLNQLVDSKIRFCFDQGGFEHKSFGNPQTLGYFFKFDQYRSKVNLWDHANVRALRPYFHITDQHTHNMISDYYVEKINAR